MEKQERFAVYVYGRDSGMRDDFRNEKAFVDSFDHYPNDSELESCWVQAKSKFHKIFYLHVEKQVRFN